MKKEARRSAERKQFVPMVSKVDRIAERINSLSAPRDYQKEKIPEGLVDSLPPEGNCFGDRSNLKCFARTEL